MRERPGLADERIMAALHAHYGISATGLTFLALGADSASFVYRVETTDGTPYFLKVRAAGGFSLPSLAVPSYLQGYDVPHIVAPLPTVTQALWVGVQDFALSLYPFIPGQMGADVCLSAQHWREFGALMKQIHTRQLPPDLLQIVPRETFTPSGRHLIPDLEAAAGRQTLSTPVERELAAVWHAHRDEIRMLVERADALGDQLRHRSAPLVLCHADMHPWNLLIDTAQQFWLVDWDSLIIARKERDLMFVVGGIGGYQVGQNETACFFEGYADTVIDPTALAYYRCAWAVQDIAAFGEEILFLPHLGEETRRAALRWFVGLFSPGGIVSLALASDVGG